MSTFTSNNVSSGAIIYASDHNEMGSRIAAVLNGGIDSTNVSSLNGSKINDGTLAASAMVTSVNPNTLLGETIQPFVQSGCVWSSVSGLNGTMSSGVVYGSHSGQIFRVAVSTVSSHTFTASKDTYVDIDYAGTISYNEVANGASAPSLTSGSVRTAKVVTSGSAITSVTTSGNDGQGNIIYPAGPLSPKLTQAPYQFSVYRNSALTPSGTAVVTFDTKEYDTGNNVDITTNKGRFTAPIAGFYHFEAHLSGAVATRMLVMLYKNGSEFKRGTDWAGTAGIHGGVVSADVLAAASDYFEIYVNTGSTAIDVGSTIAYFQGRLTSVS